MPKYKLDRNNSVEMFIVATQASSKLFEGKTLHALLGRNVPWYRKLKFHVGTWWRLRKAVRAQLKALDNGQAELLTRVPREQMGMAPMPTAPASKPLPN